jgi:hypothetical protein
MEDRGLENGSWVNRLLWELKYAWRDNPMKKKNKEEEIFNVLCHSFCMWWAVFFFFWNSRNSLWPFYTSELGIGCYLLHVGFLSLFFDPEYGSSSETSADFQRTTRRYIPEDRTLHNDRCENPKSFIMLLSSGGLTPYSRLNSRWAGIMDSNFSYYNTICAFTCTADIIMNL